MNSAVGARGSMAPTHDADVDADSNENAEADVGAAGRLNARRVAPATAAVTHPLPPPWVVEFRV